MALQADAHLQQISTTACIKARAGQDINHPTFES